MSRDATVTRETETAATPQPNSTLNMRTAARLIGALLLLQIPALVGRDIVADTAALWSREITNPYFRPLHLLQVWVVTPAVVLSTLVFLLAPGLQLAHAYGLGRSLERWILFGFALSLILISTVTAVVQSIAGGPVVGASFVATVLLCFCATAAWLLYRVRGNIIAVGALSRVSAALLLLVPCALLVALAPKFYWENFNGDGAHAFESSRLLLHQALPFWDPLAGEIAAFPGVTSMLFAYPGAWFIRLFGELEVAARLPLLLYLVVLFCALAMVIESGRLRPLRAREKAAIWGALVVYILVVGFSATYSPYSADVALPATQDTLLVACLLGFILCFAEERIGWMFAFGLLTFVSLPNGLLLLALWGTAVLLTWRPLPWRPLLWLIGLGGLCVLISAAAPRLLAAIGVPAPGDEYGMSSLLGYFEELRLNDWRRFTFMIVPAGILPALSLLMWRWQDRLARAVTLVTAASFLFFYVQAATALHYYIPAMLLPLVVYWRLRPVVMHRPAPVMIATLSGLVAAMVLSWPASFAIETNAATVGAAFSVPDTNYRQMAPVAFRRASVMKYVFPYDWNPAVPDSSYGGSPLVWNYYANHAATLPAAANYILQEVSAPAPIGASQAGQLGRWVIYVRDDSVWRAHRALRPAARPGSPLYWIPQQEKFR